MMKNYAIRIVMIERYIDYYLENSTSLNKADLVSSVESLFNHLNTYVFNRTYLDISESVTPGLACFNRYCKPNKHIIGFTIGRYLSNSYKVVLRLIRDKHNMKYDVIIETDKKLKKYVNLVKKLDQI